MLNDKILDLAIMKTNPSLTDLLFSHQSEWLDFFFTTSKAKQWVAPVEQ